MKKNPISGALFVFGAAVGAVAGVAAGLLLAPKPGKETQEDIKKKAKELKTKFDKDVMPKLEKKVKEIKKDVSGIFEEKKPAKKPAKK